MPIVTVKYGQVTSEKFRDICDACRILNLVRHGYSYKIKKGGDKDGKENKD